MVLTPGPANLPAWLPSFCRSVTRVNGQWVVESPEGGAVFAFVEHNPYGVLDHTVTLASGAVFTNPMRVIPNGDGSEILFTLRQHEGMSDRQFEADEALVRGDLERLRSILEGVKR